MFEAVFKHYRAALTGIPRSIWLLAFAGFINRTGTMVLPFLTLYLVKKLGFSPAEAGSIVALYGLGGIGGSFLGGKICDRFDPVRVQVASLSATAAGFLILERLSHPFALSAFVFFLSLVGEAMRPANHHATAILAPADVRQRAFTLNRLAVNLGMMIGPVIGGFLAQLDYRLLFLIDAATCLGAAALLWFWLGRERHVSNARATADLLPGRSPWRDPIFLAVLLCTFLSAMIFFQINATYMLYLNEHYRFSEGKIGVVLAPNTLVIVLFEIVLVNAVRRFDRLKTIGLGCFLIGAGFCLVPLGRGTIFAVATVLVWTVGEMLSLSLLSAWVADRAPAAQRGRYIGLYTAAFSVAYAAAPKVGTWVYEHVSPDAIFYACGAVGAVLIVAFHGIAARIRHSARPTVELAP